MTTVGSPTEAVVEQTTDTGRGGRLMVGAVAVLAIALVAVTGWAVVSQSAEDSLPGEIEELLDGYMNAWENQDVAALRELVTEDYLLNEFIYLDHQAGNRRGVFLHDRVDDYGVSDVRMLVEWQIERVGPPLVTGEDPWFVSIEENYTWLDSYLPGMSSYVVVERDGVLKVANHSWAGLLTALEGFE